MLLNKLGKDFNVLKMSHSGLMIANPILAGLLAVSLYFNVTDEVIIQKDVPQECKAMFFTGSTMSEGNHIKFSNYIAETLGNITPKNAKFKKDSVLSFASPEIYQDVQRIIDEQIQYLINDEISLSFTAELSQVEDGKTFVTGKGSMTGPTGVQEKFIRTYEFVWEVNDYAPTFKFVDVYNDVAHNEDWRIKNASKMERRNGNEN